MPGEKLNLVLLKIRRLIGEPAGAAGNSDASLLGRFIDQRDEAAFTLLVQRYSTLVLNVCRRVLGDHDAVDDACQATFIVLARRAAVIRNRSSIGSWLYCVAYRAALRARAKVARHHQTARTGEDMDRIALAAADRRSDPASQANWDDVRTILDEELHDLPEQHRSPLVLCYLQGYTNEQAAAELNCPTGSMSWRLTQAREKLCHRLKRRGVTLATATLGTLLAQNGAAVAAPAPLVQANIQAAIKSAANAEIIALSEGILESLAARKPRKWALILFLSLFLVGLAALCYHLLTTGGKSTADGWRLTLSASQTETVLLADGSNAAPVMLDLAFTNLGDQPAKLNLRNLRLGRLELTVEDPDENVMTLRLDGAQPVADEVNATDFVSIEPGESFIWAKKLAFPGAGARAGLQPIFRVSMPGTYRLKFTYRSKPEDLIDPSAEGTWTGELVSNELVLKVIQMGARQPRRGTP